MAPHEVVLGLSELGAPVVLDLARLMEGRLLIQGVSGAGKSWTLRRLLEQTAALVQQIVVDPEGEFQSLAEELGHLHVDASQMDARALGVLARRVREHRLSVVIDISDLSREEQMRAVAALFVELIECPREFWTPALVAVDEAHLFAPFGGQSAAATAVRKAAIGATTDLMSRGRKRGLAGVLATQRLARLAKSVASEVQNFLFGMNTLDLDVRRAAETIGWDSRRAFDRLPLLEPGQFVAVGPAFSSSPALMTVGSVSSRHIGATPSLQAPARVAPDQARSLVDIDGLAEASAAVLEEETPERWRAVRLFMRDPAFVDAARIFGALREIAPDGTTANGLARHLQIEPAAATAALALLDRYAAVEAMGEGDGRIVRAQRTLLTDWSKP